MIGICDSTGHAHDREGARPGRQVLGQELAVEVAGDAERQDVDHRAADDLVGLELDRHDGVQRGQQSPRRGHPPAPPASG